MSITISSDFIDIDSAQFAISAVTSGNINVISADIIPKNHRRPSSAPVYINVFNDGGPNSNREYGSDQNYTALGFMPMFIAEDANRQPETFFKEGCVLKLSINDADAAAVKENLYAKGASNVRIS